MNNYYQLIIKMRFDSNFNDNFVFQVTTALLRDIAALEIKNFKSDTSRNSLFILHRYLQFYK